MGGRGSTSGKAGGGNSGKQAAHDQYGEINTGISVKFSNGKVRNYYVTTNGLKEIRTLAPAPKSKGLTTKEQVIKMLENDNVKFLSKSAVKELLDEYHKGRKDTPDYETGNPFQERGKGKNIYRPKRQKW